MVLGGVVPDDSHESGPLNLVFGILAIRRQLLWGTSHTLNPRITDAMCLIKCP